MFDPLPVVGKLCSNIDVAVSWYYIVLVGGMYLVTRSDGEMVSIVEGVKGSILLMIIVSSVVIYIGPSDAVREVLEDERGNECGMPV